MRGIIRKLVIFLYFFLVLFVQTNTADACKNIAQNAPQQFISQLKPETITNIKNEENYSIVQNQNKTEIRTLANKNNFGFGNCNQFVFDFNCLNNSIISCIKYPILISHNTSSILKNSIQTRAP